MSNLEFVIASSLNSPKRRQSNKFSLDLLKPVRRWLDQLEINDPKLARFLYQSIPGHCPFERDIVVLGRKLGHIPPLCKLNPLYEQLVG